MRTLQHAETSLPHPPYHARIAAMNRLPSWGPWAGYARGPTHEDPAMEHPAIRKAAPVDHLCPMVKYRIEGPAVAPFLNRLTPDRFRLFYHPDHRRAPLPERF